MKALNLKGDALASGEDLCPWAGGADGGRVCGRRGGWMRGRVRAGVVARYGSGLWGEVTWGDGNCEEGSDEVVGE